MAEFLRTLKIDTFEKKLLAATALGLVAYGGYKFLSSRRSALCEAPASKFANEPGLGHDEYPGFPAETVPGTMPDLSEHNSFMAEILR